jgi:hypothetical protein
MGELLLRAVRWATWTPRRLAATIVTLAVLVAMAARILAGGSHPAQPPSSTGHVITGDRAQPPAAGDSAAPPTPAENTDAELVAERFLQAWMDHSQPTQQAWEERLRPWETPQFEAQMAGADPARVPAHNFTSGIQTVTSGPEMATLRVGTDAGDMILTMQHVRWGWAVDDIEPAGQEPGQSEH